jgi:hypothetical protein
MNTAASPGRTWTILINQRQLPSLAGAITTALLRGRDCLAHLAGMGGAASSAFFANARRQGDPRVEPFAERDGDRHLGVPFDSIQVRFSANFIFCELFLRVEIVVCPPGGQRSQHTPQSIRSSSGGTSPPTGIKPAAGGVPDSRLPETPPPLTAGMSRIFGGGTIRPRLVITKGCALEIPWGEGVAKAWGLAISPSSCADPDAFRKNESDCGAEDRAPERTGDSESRPHADRSR